MWWRILGAALVIAFFMSGAPLSDDSPGVLVSVALGAEPPAGNDADADEDDPLPYRPGAIARYTGADGKPHVRLEEQIVLACGDRPPDRRVPAGPFEAKFAALVLVQSPGVHRLRVYAAGRVEVTLAGKRVVNAHAPEPGWLDAQPVDLPFGFHPLVVHYARDGEPARLALFWEGPGFALEPLAARWLFHKRGETPGGDFERGRHLARALRCAACHDVPGESGPLVAPALDRLRGNIARAWIVERLSAQPDGAADADLGRDSSERMPHFGFDRADAEAVTDYLLSATAGSQPPVSQPRQPAERAPAKSNRKGSEEEDDTPEVPSAAAGATLFRSVGCLACHRVGQLGSDGLFGGGDLSAIGAKRPADFFERWLTNPGTLNRTHRMPVFALEPLEVAHLSLYLQSLGKPQQSNAPADDARAACGADLVRAFRCTACHALPASDDGAPKRLPLDLAAIDRAEASCLFTPDAARRRPGYRLDEKSRRALREYLSGASHVAEPIAPDGHDLLAEHNCLACHARGHAAGLKPRLAEVVAADPELRAVQAVMAPPSLVGVGDKLHEEALAASIARSAAPHQTWLRVRMPKFPLADAETATLARHFIDTDRMPERADIARGDPQPASDSQLAGAGARLVNADGFACTSCHAIGNWTPEKVEPGAQGADLSTIGRRVRRDWFDRWVRNPVRMVPDMEMPSIVKPIRGVLDEDLDRQIAAMWHVLDREGFTPPAPGALRVVRRANLSGESQPAAVLTDVIEVGKTRFVKPLVIGFNNRHNVLYDLATARLAAWWIGDTARQRTRGKTWFWEAGLPQLLPLPADESAATGSQWSLVRGEDRYEAVPHGQYTTEFDSIAHVERGVELVHRVHFRVDGNDVGVRVTQTFVGLGPGGRGGRSGFERSVQIGPLPEGMRLELVALPGKALLTRNLSAVVGGESGAVRVSFSSPRAGHFTVTDRGAVIMLGDGRPPLDCNLTYRTGIAVDQYPPRPEADRRVERAELRVVPGFETVRLPLDERCMPTGLAWRPDGTLVVSSLEGRVWLARDTDGDGLEDAIAPFSDDLAAPFGVATERDAIDVVNKYGLLRLFDDDRDGRADRTETIASGWGHTRDYHDWAIGLPRDPEGNYYVSLPCVQDDRSEAAARHRGRVVKLSPREPTPDDPRRFSIEEICAGLRFPQGIARSPEGELFVTDNQGHYNPFNELNHVVQDARYGFIDSLEIARGLNPPFRTAAIEIPHPWTRSVNGICFLATPEAANKGRGDAPFGPFAGQLIGCEYDTRRLVRMSLERVAGEYQGAVYPLSVEPGPSEETFEGPLVCQVSPAGDLYVGNIRDSGWGAGRNTGSIVRLRWQGDLPVGIAQVRAQALGFRIDFTRPVDTRLAADAGNYSISSYRRIATPEYGGPDVDRRVDAIKHIAISSDGRFVAIELAELREDFVYEFHLRDLVEGERLFPSEAYYTLRRRPGD